MRPGYQEGSEPVWWWKVAQHLDEAQLALDEAQLALTNAMAHNVDDPRPGQALQGRLRDGQGRLREGQAILLDIFRAKGLLPAVAGPPTPAPPPPATMPGIPGTPPSPPFMAPPFAAPPFGDAAPAVDTPPPSSVDHASASAEIGETAATVAPAVVDGPPSEAEAEVSPHANGVSTADPAPTAEAASPEASAERADG